MSIFALLTATIADSSDICDNKYDGNYVSKNENAMNSECIVACGQSDATNCQFCQDNCIVQSAQYDSVISNVVFPDEHVPCWDQWVHGYEEDGKSTSENAEIGTILTGIESPNECQNACQQDDDCSRWIFNLSNDVGLCILKSELLINKAFEQVLPDAMSPYTDNTWPPLDENDAGASYLPDTEDPRWYYCNLTLDYNCNAFLHGLPMYDCALCQGDVRCVYISHEHVAGPKYCNTYIDDICDTDSPFDSTTPATVTTVTSDTSTDISSSTPNVGITDQPESAITTGISASIDVPDVTSTTAVSPTDAPESAITTDSVVSTDAGAIGTTTAISPTVAPESAITTDSVVSTDAGAIGTTTAVSPTVAPESAITTDSVVSTDAGAIGTTTAVSPTDAPESAITTDSVVSTDDGMFSSGTPGGELQSTDDVPCFNGCGRPCPCAGKCNSLVPCHCGCESQPDLSLKLKLIPDYFLVLMKKHHD